MELFGACTNTDHSTCSKWFRDDGSEGRHRYTSLVETGLDFNAVVAVDFHSKHGISMAHSLFSSPKTSKSGNTSRSPCPLNADFLLLRLSKHTVVYN